MIVRIFCGRRSQSLLVPLTCLLATSFSFAATSSLEQDVTALQHGWATAWYQTPEAQKEVRFEALAADAQAVVDRNPGRAEPMIWQAIILSSSAKFQGGLGALDKIKHAREELLTAEKIDPHALDGSVYTSLGSLYATAPGWPLSFGDKQKAKVYLEKALAINPDGIDPNFFYGELLADLKQPTEARRYLEKALAAPPRPGRADADAGRRAEIQNALSNLNTG
jgi:tetratricopeptide (TPR) repeat protein